MPTVVRPSTLSVFWSTVAVALLVGVALAVSTWGLWPSITFVVATAATVLVLILDLTTEGLPDLHDEKELLLGLVPVMVSCGFLAITLAIGVLQAVLAITRGRSLPAILAAIFLTGIIILALIIGIAAATKQQATKS